MLGGRDKAAARLEPSMDDVFDLHLVLKLYSMSSASKLTLAGAFLFTGLTIFGVHYQQRKEHEVGCLILQFAQ